MASKPGKGTVGTYSLDKSKIKFLLLEGIHEQAVDVIRGHGYGEVELMRRALSGAELSTVLEGVHFLGIRSRSRVDKAIITAVDVFPLEPGSNADSFESPLRGMNNVLLTPHIGGSTMEAQENIAIEVASKLVKYSDNGTTRSAVNFPQISLPDHENASRILHIHRNEPGVLQRINTVFSAHAVNIASQYLDTDKDIGYMVMDIETDQPLSLLEELREIPATIRTRILH